MTAEGDYAIHRTTGTGEIGLFPAVSNRKEDTPRRRPEGRKKRRRGEDEPEDSPGDEGVEVELTGLDAEDAEADPDEADEADPAGDGDESPSNLPARGEDRPSVDYLA